MGKRWHQLLWISTVLKYTCCVFRPAFGCGAHPKAGWTTFFQPFSTSSVHFKPYFFALFSFFTFFMQTMWKKYILASIWSVHHLNACQNMQHSVVWLISTNTKQDQITFELKSSNVYKHLHFCHLFEKPKMKIIKL